jgi:4-hydroxybenzoate polyprenyltransferase
MTPRRLPSLAFARGAGDEPKRRFTMLWTLIVVLLVLWLLGVVTSVGGPLIHLLLAIAVIVFLVRLISGGRSAV